jgi:hypothetical protein
VDEYGTGWCVVLRTGGSGFHFRISVCTSPPGRRSPLWWIDEYGGLEQQSILLETEGK